MLKPEHIDVSLLPPAMQEIAECIGIEATVALFTNYNGVRFRVYQKAEADHIVAQLIGFDLYKKLVREFGGENINACKIDKVLHQQKIQTIIKLKSEDWKVSDIALEVNLHERTIYRTLQEHKANEDQLTLPI